MYSSFESDNVPPSGLRRLARRDLSSTPRTPRLAPAPVAAPTPAAESPWPRLTLQNALEWTRRRLVWIILLAIVGAAAGYGLTLVVAPRYTAYTDLVVDPANLQVVTNDIYAANLDQNAQLLDVESKLRVLTSGNVLRQVVLTLGLQNDPEFVAASGPLAFLGGATDTDPVLEAMASLEKKVTARREERSYVVTIGVSTQSAAKSVTIADAVVVAFQNELARGETEGAARSAAALMDRLAELKSGVTEAEEAVQRYRREHGLEQTAQGELLNVQSLSLLNQQLLTAQQALVAAEARYTEITDPTTGRLNADAIQTPVMVALRTQYGQIKQTVDASASLYGPRHPNRLSGDQQLAGIQAQINAEAARYVQALRVDVEQARGTVQQLQQQTTDARGVVATDGDSQVELRELERDASAKGAVYEAFLTRAREITERQQLDTTNIRVISPATPPGARSWPPRGYVVAGAGGAAGLALGLALALGLGFLAAARQSRKAA